jgi:hypothetical protein
MGEEWLRNYRFLLNRDRAVRHVVAAKTGRDPARRGRSAEPVPRERAGLERATPTQAGAEGRRGRGDVPREADRDGGCAAAPLVR